MSITSAGSLNTLGVAELSEQKLIELFQNDNEKFFKFTNRRITLFHKALASDFYKFTVYEATLHKLEELQHKANSINCIRRFIDSTLGLNNDKIEDKLAEREPKLAELADKYDVLAKEFQDKRKKNTIRETDTPYFIFIYLLPISNKQNGKSLILMEL